VCTSCDETTLNADVKTFEALQDGPGNPSVNWELVRCEAVAGVTFRFSSGSSQDNAKLQVIN
ncbi:hypothetical protein L0F63_006486, partial [Massospora cicadina]